MVYKVGDHKVYMYDSIHELPILRFQRFNKYHMQAMQVGNTFSDYDERIQKVVAFISHDMKEEALQELENGRLTMFNAFNEFYPKGKAFAIMVKKIDDVVYNSFAPDELDRCLEHLEKIGLPNGVANEKLEEVKKK